ncbi:MAG: hypothetical protein K2X98_04700 [Alphaproteobacteria bacterium]|nr:hypothetical protein [Alphaproteobacteria bacterium]
MELFKLFYPFVQNNTDIIKCLSYCPVLSNLLAHSKTPVNLDAFCLDASILFSHDMNISQKPENKDFMERTGGLPIMDVNDLKLITDPTFNQELQDWNTAYTKRLEEFSAKWPPLTTGKIIEPQEKEISETPSQKKKKKAKKKRPKKAKAPSTSTTSSQDKEEEDKEGDVDDASDKSPEPEIISTITSSSSTTTVTTDSVDAISPPSQKKKEKKQQKALDRKRALDALAFSNTSSSSTSSSTTVNVPPSPHPLLAPTDTFKLNSSTHYDVLVNLMENTLKPTIRYEIIESAIESLGIIIESLGNGDYRKLILPNGRKIFIYRPAVPQAGKRLLKTLREGLFEKWGLTAAHLDH